MHPLGSDMPKGLMPLWGTPILGRLVNMLRKWGVKHVLINLHHACAEILRYVVDSPSGLQVDLSYEPTILGTGGALRRAEWFTGNSPFWIVNSDIAAELTPEPILQAYCRTKAIAALWVTRDAGPRTVEMSGSHVTCFRSKNPGHAGNYTFCGLHLVSPAIMAYLPRKMPFSIIEVYENAMRDSRKITGACAPDSFWADMGTPESYLDTHIRCLEAYRRKNPGQGLYTSPALSARKYAGVTFDGAVSLGRNVSIARGAVIRDSIVWDNVRINSGARVTHAVIGKDAILRGSVTGIAVPATATGDTALLAALSRLGWPGQSTTAILLPPRGSERNFTRIQHGRQRAIVIKYSLDRPENGRYVRNARFLNRLGIRVPHVLLDMPRLHTTVIEDLGNRSLLSMVTKKSEATVERRYRRVIEAVALLHDRGLRNTKSCRLGMEEPFSRKLYHWEHELFRTHFMRNQHDLGDGLSRGVMRDLKSVSERLLAEPDVLVHRDLQSTNILFIGGTPAFIDFQGMRPGPAAYDLASLLCDPYVSLPETMQLRLLRFYGTARNPPIRVHHSLFWAASVERLIQAIGAFARLAGLPAASMDGAHSFPGNIKPAFKMLHRAIQHLDNLPHLRQLIDTVPMHARHGEKGVNR